MVKRPIRELMNWGGIENQSRAREEEKEGYILNISEALDYVAFILGLSFIKLYIPCASHSAKREFSKHLLEWGNEAESIIFSNCLVGMV